MEAAQQPLTGVQQQLFWADIGTIQTIDWVAADRRLLPVWVWEWSIWFLFIAGAAITGVILLDLSSVWVWLAVALSLLALYGLAYFLIQKSWAGTAYAFREQDLLARKGWLFQETHVVPLQKIQHLVIKTGPIEKRYQLATLKLYTAAGTFSDISVVGLTGEQAALLKEWITRQNQRHDG
jgi:membrane protein YdbS with pleckstrin-like domain